VTRRVFLLSPADCSGKRATLLRLGRGDSELARRLSVGRGAEIGEVFAFVSSLYFRGKLAYARAFAASGDVHVITPADGLRPPETAIRRTDLARYAEVPVDANEARYREPLLADLSRLAPEWGGDTPVVLLGSIASPKYTGPLTSVLGRRLLFPADFVGRGDMSRGGLLLRSAREGRELRYAPVLGTERRGTRPPRLPRLPRTDPPSLVKKGTIT